MKIRIISTSDRKGGAAIAAFRLFKALNNRDRSAGMLVRDKYSDEEDIVGRDQGMIKRVIHFLRFVAERLYFLPYERSKEIRFFFSPANTGEDISNLKIIRSADIIHLHWINQGFLSLSDIQKLISTGKPFVWTLHDMWPFTGGCHYSGECERFKNECGDCPFLKNPGPHDLSYRILKKKTRIFKDATITIVGPSLWMSGLAKESRLFNNFRIETIPNPIDTGLFRPGDPVQARKSLGLPEDRFLILAGAANLDDKRKGFRLLVDALMMLVEKEPGLRDKAALVTFGKSKDDIDPGLPVYSKQFLTEEKELVSLYQAADIFVLPSLEDNLPNTISESLTCGTPVVAFNTGGVPEMIIHEKTGFLAEKGDSSSLAEGIFRMFSNPAMNEMKDNCRETAVRMFSNETVASQYRSLYMSLMKK